eukprot:scaffold11704_cov72-Phaeocystis_antarctica.AAC.5
MLPRLSKARLESMSSRLVSPGSSANLRFEPSVAYARVGQRATLDGTVGRSQHERRRAAVAEVGYARERGAHVHVVHVTAVLVAIPMELYGLGRVTAGAHLRPPLAA